MAKYGNSGNSGQLYTGFKAVMSNLANNGASRQCAKLAKWQDYGEYLTGSGNFGHFNIFMRLDTACQFWPICTGLDCALAKMLVQD